MVAAAQHAVKCHPYWKAQYERLEPRKGRNKALVAEARRLLVAVWHILAHNVVDIHADATQVACSFFKHAYDVGVKNLPNGPSALQYTRNQLDRLGIGAELKTIPWGSKKFKLPPSKLAACRGRVVAAYAAHVAHFVKHPPAAAMLSVEIYFNRPHPLLSLPSP